MLAIPLADNFLAGSIISLLLPVGLLIAIAVWYVFGVKRFLRSSASPDTPAVAPPEVPKGEG